MDLNDFKVKAEYALQGSLTTGRLSDEAHEASRKLEKRSRMLARPEGVGFPTAEDRNSFKDITLSRDSTGLCTWPFNLEEQDSIEQIGIMYGRERLDMDNKQAFYTKHL